MSENGSALKRAATPAAKRAVAAEARGPPGPGTIPLQRERAQTIFEKGAPGRRAFVCPPLDVPLVSERRLLLPRLLPLLLLELPDELTGQLLNSAGLETSPCTMVSSLN